MPKKIVVAVKLSLSLVLTCQLLVSASPLHNNQAQLMQPQSISEVTPDTTRETGLPVVVSQPTAPSLREDGKQLASRGDAVREVPPTQPQPAPPAPPTVENRARQQDLNSYVLSLLPEYGVGSYPYLLNADYSNYNGVTRDIYYRDSLLLKAHPSGNRASHCVGITFEVFFRAMQARNLAAGLAADDFNGMSSAAMQDFMLRWYAAGPKRTHNLAAAVEQYGLGRRLTDLGTARAGDFIDFSRTNGTGHAGVLIDWIKREGQIIGLRYWSSQESTGGIAYTEEYFDVLRSNGSPYGNVRLDSVYLARVESINDYRR